MELHGNQKSIALLPNFWDIRISELELNALFKFVNPKKRLNFAPSKGTAYIGFGFAYLTFYESIIYHIDPSGCKKPNYRENFGRLLAKSC